MFSTEKKKKAVIEALITVLILTILQNKVHVSRNCSDVLLLQEHVLCVSQSLFNIRDKGYLKSFSLLQVFLEQQFKN